jgi:hypothetical protein
MADEVYVDVTSLRIRTPKIDANGEVTPTNTTRSSPQYRGEVKLATSLSLAICVLNTLFMSHHIESNPYFTVFALFSYLVLAVLLYHL